MSEISIATTRNGAVKATHAETKGSLLRLPIRPHVQPVLIKNAYFQVNPPSGERRFYYGEGSEITNGSVSVSPNGFVNLGNSNTADTDIYIQERSEHGRAGTIHHYWYSQVNSRWFVNSPHFAQAQPLSSLEPIVTNRQLHYAIQDGVTGSVEHRVSQRSIERIVLLRKGNPILPEHMQQYEGLPQTSIISDFQEQQQGDKRQAVPLAEVTNNRVIDVSQLADFQETANRLPGHARMEPELLGDLEYLFAHTDFNAQYLLEQGIRPEELAGREAQTHFLETAQPVIFENNTLGYPTGKLRGLYRRSRFEVGRPNEETGRPEVNLEIPPSQVYPNGEHYAGTMHTHIAYPDTIPEESPSAGFQNINTKYHQDTPMMLKGLAEFHSVMEILNRSGRIATQQSCISDGDILYATRHKGIHFVRLKDRVEAIAPAQDTLELTKEREVEMKVLYRRFRLQAAQKLASIKPLEEITDHEVEQINIAAAVLLCHRLNLGYYMASINPNIHLKEGLILDKIA